MATPYALGGTPRSLSLGEGASSSWACRPIAHGTDLDREAGPQQWMVRHELEHLVEVLGVQDGVAGQLLLGLGERAVGDERLATLQTHRRRRARALQPFAAQVEAAGPPGLAVVDGPLHDRLLLGLRERIPPLLVLVDQQHVAHVILPGWARAPRARAPHSEGGT